MTIVTEKAPQRSVAGSHFMFIAEKTGSHTFTDESNVDTAVDFVLKLYATSNQRNASGALEQGTDLLYVLNYDTDISNGNSVQLFPATSGLYDSDFGTLTFDRISTNVRFRTALGFSTSSGDKLSTFLTPTWVVKDTFNISDFTTSDVTTQYVQVSSWDDYDVIVETNVTTGSVGGDPYLSPFAGPRLKLPNKPATYRLYQNKDTSCVINIVVDQCDVKLPVTSATSPAYLRPVDGNAFFITRIEVNDSLYCLNDIFEQSELKWVTSITYQHNDVAPNVGYFHSRKFYVEDGLSIEARLYKNPQIRSELVVHYSASGNTCDGLIFKNYRPVLWEIKNPRKRLAYIHVAPEKTRLLCKKDIVAQGESRDSIYNTTLFHHMIR